MNGIKNIADELLIKALGRGEEKAFRMFFKEWYAKVYGFALKMTGQDWAAEEIAQNVFWKIWTHKESIAELDRGKLSGYIFMIVRNEVMDWFRSRRQIKKFREEFAAEACEEADAEERMDCARTLRIIDEIVRNMPPVRRQVFIMSRYSHHTNSEIASMLGISRRTVEKHLSLSLAMLRKALM